MERGGEGSNIIKKRSKAEVQRRKEHGIGGFWGDGFRKTVKWVSETGCLSSCGETSFWNNLKHLHCRRLIVALWLGHAIKSPNWGGGSIGEFPNAVLRDGVGNDSKPRPGQAQSALNVVIGAGGAIE